MTELKKADDAVSPLEKVFPEVRAGGYSRLDGTIEFWTRVNAILPSSPVVLDLGAGRGQFLNDQVRYRRDLHDLRPRCSRLIGLDVDPAVLENPAVSEAHVIPESGLFPCEDSSIDVVVSDWTFEHISNPTQTAAEIDRVLRPGGWLCARTPRKWGAIGIPTRLIPNKYHVAFLNILQPRKLERDTFPTAYKLNSRSALRELFPQERYLHCVYEHNSEPGYVGHSEPAMRAGVVVQRLMPSRAAATLMVFLQKKGI